MNQENPERKINFPEIIDGLITHMNKTRTLFLILIIASLIITPTSIIFAVILLSPSIVSEIGSDYVIMGDDRDEFIVSNFTMPLFSNEHQLHGLYVGNFTGKLLGDNIPSHVSEFTEIDTKNIYMGEFVGSFDGHLGILMGEFNGNFTGDFETFYEGISTNSSTSGIYRGEFVGEFTGIFYNFDDQDAIAENVQQHVVPSKMMTSGVSLGYFPIDVDTIEFEMLVMDESLPRYMMIGDGAMPFEQTDITLLIIVFIIIVIVTSVVILYVGIREMIFFSKWNNRFKEFINMKKQIDKELND